MHTAACRKPVSTETVSDIKLRNLGIKCHLEFCRILLKPYWETPQAGLTVTGFGSAPSSRSAVLTALLLIYTFRTPNVTPFNLHYYTLQYISQSAFYCL